MYLIRVGTNFLIENNALFYRKQCSTVSALCYLAYACQLRVQGIVSVSSNRVHVYIKIVHVTAAITGKVNTIVRKVTNKKMYITTDSSNTYVPC